MLVKDNAKSCQSIPPLLINDNEHTTSEEEKANALNDYFVSISTVDDTNVNLPRFIAKTNESLNPINVNELEIRDVIDNLEVNKAAGPDEISHRMLKETKSTICKPLCLLFNRSLQEGIYPEKWKIANVMPLFKKGDRNKPCNYRPISLISCIGKVMERIVFKHMYNHLSMHNLIYKNQSGFIPGHSTVYQLIDIYNQICTAFDQRKSTCIIFCDISKAFDRVWHNGLFHKLQQNGFNGTLLRWITDYLSNRRHRVLLGLRIQIKSLLPQEYHRGRF